MRDDFLFFIYRLLELEVQMIGLNFICRACMQSQWF